MNLLKCNSHFWKETIFENKPFQKRKLLYLIHTWGYNAFNGIVMKKIYNTINKEKFKIPWTAHLTKKNYKKK